MDLDKFKKIVKESYSYSDVCKKIYNNNYYGNRKTIKNKIEKNKIDISHFKRINNNKEHYGKHKKIDLNSILVKNSTYTNINYLKIRLYNERLKKPICELCGQDEYWYGNKMSLILDHINGINNDHRLENLRIVCPNCNATLPTFSGRNVNNNK